MSADVFISHSSQDKVVADQMCAFLESAGLRCWIAPRNIKVGTDWGVGIMEGINHSTIAVLILSSRSNDSGWVQSEVVQVVRREMPIIVFQIEDVALSDSLEINLRRWQWQEATAGPLEGHFEKLRTELENLLHKKRGKRGGGRRPVKPARSSPSVPPPVLPRTDPAIDLAELPNPYDFAGSATRKTFKGRDKEINELLSSIESGTHTAVFGLQRMGKTSLIEEGLREGLEKNPALAKSVLLAKIDLQGLGGEQLRYRDLVEAIIENIKQKLDELGLGGGGDQDVRRLTHELFAPSRYRRGDRTEFFTNFAVLLRGFATAAHRRIVLFIDEFSELRKVIDRNTTALQRNPVRTGNILPHDMYLDVPFMHSLSSLLKDRELKEKFTLIVSVRPFWSEFDKQQELQLLKLMKSIMLYHLDEFAARALITEPVAGLVSYEEGTVDYLSRLTGGHPYLLQFILNQLLDQVKQERRRTITLTDVKKFEGRMISEGSGYDAQFNVLISDYSVSEVMQDPEAELGKGVLAVIAKLGHEQAEGWVFEEQIFDEMLERGISAEKSALLLAQLVRTKIVEENSSEDALRYRMAIPLLRKRFVRQNFYLRHFSSARKTIGKGR